MTERYRGFTFDEAALREDVDLDVERRREILFAEAHLARWTHWEALGLAWGASSEDAKVAYLAKVKLFHPDRYPAMRLGSYRARLEKVFKRITEARDVLGDPERRAVYERQSATADRVAAMEARRLEDERRGEERRARLSRQNPLLVRAARQRELVERGKAAFQEGRFAQAANDLQVALSMDPGNREVAALVVDAKKKAAAVKANDLYEKGMHADVMGHPGEALAAFREALAAEPGHVRAGAAAARVAVQLNELTDARTFAEAALKAGPRAAVAHEAMAIVLEASGARKEARQALEKALELDPRLDSAKDRLKKLRWSFLG